MSGEWRPKGRSRDGLSPDEAALWEVVTEQVHPLRRAKPMRVTDTAPSDPANEPRSAPRRVPADPVPAPTPAPRWQKLPGGSTPRPAKIAPQPVPAFDRKHVKKIVAGRIEIEGRLDLHGLRESEAHMRLRGFLRQAQAMGKRTVLVITGKGREDDDPFAPFDFGMERAPRGVLKRNVPRWLSDPDLASLIVSYTTAHVRHGGEGALYVHLRKAR
jgi:DNA-nicking Smr family endonuclease